MRRAILAVTGLAAGTTLLVVLKGPSGAAQTAQSVPSARPGAPVVPASSGPAPGAVPAPGATSAAPGRTPTSGVTGPKTAAPRRTTSAPSAPRTTGTTTRPPSSPVTHYGSVARTTPDRSFGNVQVQITVVGGRVVDVTTLEMPENTPESVRRSDDVQRAYNGTQGEAVRAANGDTDLDTVSGATSTSNAYEQSLQAALDRAGLR